MEASSGEQPTDDAAEMAWSFISSAWPRGVYVLYASVGAHLRCKLLVNGATLAQKEQRITELEAELAGLKAGAT